MKDWVLENTKNFKDLEGQVLTGWRGFELALRERGADGYPVFDPGVRVRQYLRLELELASGARLVVAAMSPHGFGLSLSPGDDDGPRTAEPSLPIELPLGLVRHVTFAYDEQKHLKQVTLFWPERAIELIAGEYLTCVRGDRVLLGSEESLLVRETTFSERNT